MGPLDVSWLGGGGPPWPDAAYGRGEGEKPSHRQTIPIVLFSKVC